MLVIVGTLMPTGGIQHRWEKTAQGQLLGYCLPFLSLSWNSGGSATGSGLTQTQGVNLGPREGTNSLGLQSGLR